ncbi:MAG: nucleotidyl transferase AbiEii/AbiGii toxin family protein [Anaerolineales bacterium]|nr:nucleotidyl transferase AbiEii/AbiGii toxin family protein [Anaerolineales bacterium]
MNFTNAGLNREQENVLAQLGGWLTDQGYYLAGGTALAIYYGHRRSVDLDWFTAARIPDVLVLAQRIRETGVPFVTGQYAPGTLYGQISDVRISLIEFRYPLLKPLEVWPDNQTAIASLDDLACMKLSAIAQRGSRKDFYDTHLLLRQHCSLTDALRLFQKKFSVSDISPVLYGLAYFDDAEKEPEPMLLDKITWKQVKKDILQWLREYSRSTNR